MLSVVIVLHKPRDIHNDNHNSNDNNDINNHRDIFPLLMVFRERSRSHLFISKDHESCSCSQLWPVLLGPRTESQLRWLVASDKSYQQPAMVDHYIHLSIFSC